MAVPPASTALDDLGERRFSFYPPVLGIEHNEWVLKKATWSEILVSNTHDDREIWVPRRFLGQVSSVDEPVLIVGLLKELELKAGQVMPHVRRIIEMPLAGAESRQFEPLAPPAAAPDPGPPARSSGAESRVGRLIGLALLIGIIGCVLLIVVFRSTRDGSRIVYQPVLQSELGFQASDDYHAVVRKFGPPKADRWRADKGELQYRILDYPDRGFSVVLFGPEREKATYIGAVDAQWHVIDSVSLRGGNSDSLLRSLKPF